MTRINCSKCNGDLWDNNFDDTVSCCNCGYTRPFRKRTGNSGKPSKSQSKVLANLEKAYPNAKIEPFFQQETGYLYITVNTSPKNVYLEEGGHVKVGRRGGVEILSSYSIAKDKSVYIWKLQTAAKGDQ